MIFQIIGIVLGTLIGLFILELAIVTLIPGLPAPEQRLVANDQRANEVNEDSSYLRKDVSFKVKETVNQLGGYAEPIYYPIGHFDIYSGENFKRSVIDQLKFFEKHI